MGNVHDTIILFHNSTNDSYPIAVALYVQFGGENFSVVLGIPGISQKVLTDNLRTLESDGLVIRTVYPEIPPRVEYSLSELGNTLRPLFKDMEEWGNNYKEYVANQTDKN
jgi:DNA-binding HxlR family transcriptional regulator